MATYTRADLRDAALREIGVLDATEAAEAEDAQLANDRCQQTLEYLYDEGLIPFDLDSDSIPARYFLPLVRVIADTLVTPYGQIARAVEIKQNAADGMRALHKLKANPYYGTTLKATFY